ncbi:MAG: hypothetical protein R3204_06010, partial [Oceanospirillum sp.]|nr:hypothetical protein [Oceanospirillum sp.]
MLKYIFFPTGRDIWFELATRLMTNGVAQPVIWVGDPKHDEKARNLLKEGVVVDFLQIQARLSGNNYHVSDVAWSVYDKLRVSHCKNKTIK